MGNSPSIQPPEDSVGQAVLYINGFVYNSGCRKQFAWESYLLSPPGVNRVPQSADQVPRELEGSSISTVPQEFAAGINEINATAKKLVPDDMAGCCAGGSLLCLGITGMILLLIGGGICEDASPKDYWRTACVQMDDDCHSRQLEPLESLYPECRSSCTANMTDEELLATANPDGGQCLLCPVDTDELPTRGCQCLPTEDIRRNPCGTKKKKGCEEFNYMRVCDDITHPLIHAGVALTISAGIVFVGVYASVYGLCNPDVDRMLVEVCETLSSQSQTGTSWRYVQFTVGCGRSKKVCKCVVVTSAQHGGVVAPAHEKNDLLDLPP